MGDGIGQRRGGGFRGGLGGANGHLQQVLAGAQCVAGGESVAAEHVAGPSDVPAVEPDLGHRVQELELQVAGFALGGKIGLGDIEAPGQNPVGAADPQRVELPACVVRVGDEAAVQKGAGDVPGNRHRDAVGQRGGLGRCRVGVQNAEGPFTVQ